MSFWYNVDTCEVETDANRSRAEQVMGPYETEEEARNALARAHEKTEKWDEEDRAWDKKGAAPGWDDEGLDD